jgi:2-keto-4-pentenoate hydratase/2-oxohepta-3-ene-1,7-dioic acid hydratase in catechol pathway
VQLVSYRFPGHGRGTIAGVIEGDAVLNAGRLLSLPRSISMLALLEMGPAGIERLRGAVESFRNEYRASIMLPEDVTAPRWLAELDAPLPRPRSFRDFYAYEAHVASGYARRNREIPPAWFETPVFFYQHTGTMFGPDAVIPYPAGSQQLDFELEIAAVVGRRGRDIAIEDAWHHVAGLTILNDWSARDIQAREMSVGLGPAKGKDFATSIGPWIITLDELESAFRDNRHALSATVMINDEIVAVTNAAEHFWSLPEMIANASKQVDLEPGDLIGFGTMARGCLLELGEAVHPWLVDGDEVVLQVERLGTLRNRIGAS